MGLIKYRIKIEILWLIFQANEVRMEEFPSVSKKEIENLKSIYEEFDIDDARKVKEIEKTTNHDVKSVEYFIRDQLIERNLEQLNEFVHFCCTSEDINNLAYNLMLKDSLKGDLIPNFEEVYWKIYELGVELKTIKMIARTHGQPATPTTLGKEFINVNARLKERLIQLKKFKLIGKFNGATGNLNAHVYSAPNLDWLKLSSKFVESLGLNCNIFTTQIEPHDKFAELFLLIQQINTILIDLSRDIWSYISMDYFTQKKKEGEVGSSTMPHKVNPIDFENAEGNLGIANSLAIHLAQKLPVSRLQRDLSDSTVQRNMGLIYGYTILACQSLLKGLNKLRPNPEKIKEDIKLNYNVLAEPIQSYLRLKNYQDPYLILKKATRGKKITQDNYAEMVNQLEISNELKSKFLKLVPEDYIGLAEDLVDLFNPELHTQ